MKKVKIIVGIAAAVIGGGSALAAKLKDHGRITYTWIDWYGQVVISNATQQQAQALCVPDQGICLRTTDNIFVYTTGYLPWGRSTKKADGKKP